MEPKQEFIQYLKKQFPENWNEVQSHFELLHKLLVDINQKINLYSRQMNQEDIWTVHFLDSLLLLKSFNLDEERVLDFGSGGGLPGIPLKLVKPRLDMILLDAKAKKVKALQEIIRTLNLNHCHSVWSRLEDYHDTEKYDIIVCRSVKILPVFLTPLKGLLKKNGKILLYKSMSWEDAELFSSFKIYDVSHPAVGTRNIIEIGKI
jgi:16S rRNA (guanine527-N7)-methyltransferase